MGVLSTPLPSTLAPPSATQSADRPGVTTRGAALLMEPRRATRGSALVRQAILSHVSGQRGKITSALTSQIRRQRTDGASPTRQRSSPGHFSPESHARRSPASSASRQDTQSSPQRVREPRSPLYGRPTVVSRRSGATEQGRTSRDRVRPSPGAPLTTASSPPKSDQTRTAAPRPPTHGERAGAAVEEEETCSTESSCEIAVVPQEQSTVPTVHRPPVRCSAWHSFPGTRARGPLTFHL